MLLSLTRCSFVHRGPELVHNTYLLPAAAMEIGLIHIEQGLYDTAKKWLETAK